MMMVGNPAADDDELMDCDGGMDHLFFFFFGGINYGREKMRKTKNEPL